MPTVVKGANGDVMPSSVVGSCIDGSVRRGGRQRLGQLLDWQARYYFAMPARRGMYRRHERVVSVDRSEVLY